jgi:P27 family predicted phage terminase small subunit
MKSKKIGFKIPGYIAHKEVRNMISNIVRQLNDAGVLTHADIPQLHRMATAYNTYLDCVQIISEQGMTMENLKGETVKRPEVNIMRESWNQYLELAKEYGLTTKSKGQIKSLAQTEEDSPLDKFMKGQKGQKEVR